MDGSQKSVLYCYLKDSLVLRYCSTCASTPGKLWYKAFIQTNYITGKIFTFLWDPARRTTFHQCTGKFSSYQQTRCKSLTISSWRNRTVVMEESRINHINWERLQRERYRVPTIVSSTSHEHESQEGRTKRRSFPKSLKKFTGKWRMAISAVSTFCIQFYLR